MPKRIAIDARHVRDFGIGTYIRNLVGALARVDFENRYLLICEPGTENEFSGLPPNFQIVFYPHSDSERIGHLTFPLFLRQIRADLHHIPLSRVPLWMLDPYVVTVHDMSRQLFLVSTGLKKQLSLYRARRGLLRARKVIAVSAATRRDAETLLGIPPQHIRMIHNAPDPRFLQPARELSPQADLERRRILDRYQVHYPFVLYAGAIKPQKNIPRLIEAFAVVRGELASHPLYRDLRLLIIGDEISQFPRVRLAANQSRISNAVRFLGFVPLETLRAFYQSAAVFAFPSLHEGFGLPPLEAMACGTPVLTSNVSSLPEVVGEAALLVSPEKVFEIAHGLKELLLNEKLREQLIEKGLRHVRRFNWDRTAQEVLETYQEAMRPLAGGR